jgi:hypothetical protein
MRQSNAYNYSFSYRVVCLYDLLSLLLTFFILPSLMFSYFRLSKEEQSEDLAFIFLNLQIIVIKNQCAFNQQVIVTVSLSHCWAWYGSLFSI